MSPHGDNARAAMERFADVHGTVHPGGRLPEERTSWVQGTLSRARRDIETARRRGINGYWANIADSMHYSAVQRLAARGDYEAHTIVRSACEVYEGLRREAAGEPDASGTERTEQAEARPPVAVAD